MNFHEMKPPTFVIGYPKIILPIFLIISVLTITVSSFNMTHFSCRKSIGNYTTNSPYENNLNEVLSSLTMQASQTGFGTHKAGEVYGLYYCRGDLNIMECKACLDEASISIKHLCPRKMVAIVWFDECTIRYANRSIFSQEEENPSNARFPGRYYPSPRKFGEVLAQIMDDLTKKAAYDDSSRGYAAGQSSITESDTLYAYVQCTPDILGRPCEKCILAALTWRYIVFDYTDITAAKIVSPSCRLQYDVKPFLRRTVDDSSSLLRNKNVNGSNSASKEKKTSIITTVVLVDLQLFGTKGARTS